MQRGLVPPSDRKAYKEKVSSELIKKYKQLVELWRIVNDPFLNIAQKDLYLLEQQGKLVWDEYTEHQINTLTKLINNIQEQLTIKDEESGEVYYQILPQLITGHVDIAPGRKTDPGPRLWKKLAEQNIGAWPDEQLVAIIEKEIQVEQGIDYKWIQDNLRLYGYKIDSTGKLDEQTRDVIRAFQIHFEPEGYSGEPSVKTISLLEALIKKYYPDQQSDYPRAFKPSNEKKNNFFKTVRVNVSPTSPYNCCVIS